jgi:hypothetical protein
MNSGDRAESGVEGAGRVHVNVGCAPPLSWKVEESKK